MREKKENFVWVKFCLVIALFVFACHSKEDKLFAGDGGEIKIIKMEADSSLGYVNIEGQAVDKTGRPLYRGGGPDGYRHNKAYIYQSNSDHEPLVLDGKWQKSESQTELTYTTEVLIPKDWEKCLFSVYPLCYQGRPLYLL